MSQTPAPDQDTPGTDPEVSTADAAPSLEEQATMAADTAGLAESAGGERDDPLLGQLIADRYEIQRLLGEGGMGAVYLAEHVMMQKPVALKVLHPELSQHDEIVARFQREARAAAAINHPNICAATDFGRLPDGASFLVMEYLQGRTLEDVIRAHGRLGTARAVHITDQICSVLSMAHAKGIVHRDLKPENIMLVTWDGDADVVKVMDFGIASMRPGGGDESEEDPAQSRLTRAGVAYGTPTYMSPEQVAGAPDIDGRADLYTLGAILFEMLTGRPPFQGSSITRLMSQHLTAPIPSAREVAPEGRIPPQLDAVLERMLAKEREDRYASADELREALGQLALPEPDPGPPAALSAGARANRAPAAAVTAITAARTRFDALPQHFKLATLAVPMLAGLVVLAAIPPSPSAPATAPPPPPKTTPPPSRSRPARSASPWPPHARTSSTTRPGCARSWRRWPPARPPASPKSSRAGPPSSAPAPTFTTTWAWPGAPTRICAARSPASSAPSSSTRATPATRPPGGRRRRPSPLASSTGQARRAGLARRDRAPPGAPRSPRSPRAARRRRARSRPRGPQGPGWSTRLPPWRQGAIELRHASTCKEHASAIARARADGDPRASARLRRDVQSKPRRGCGLLRNKDCYACVRDDIARAIEALEAKEEPGDDESSRCSGRDDERAAAIAPPRHRAGARRFRARKHRRMWTSSCTGGDPIMSSGTHSGSDPLVGQLIAERYQIQRRLGQGAIGAVYLAEHVMMKKPVALKVLHPDSQSRHPETVTRFQREAQAAATINHPNICAATDFVAPARALRR